MNWNTVGGSLLGGALGAGTGYFATPRLEDEDASLKRKRRNAVIGGLAGTVGGGALAHAMMGSAVDKSPTLPRAEPTKEIAQTIAKPEDDGYWTSMLRDHGVLNPQQEETILNEIYEGDIPDGARAELKSFLNTIKFPRIPHDILSKPSSGLEEDFERATWMRLLRRVAEREKWWEVRRASQGL